MAYPISRSTWSRKKVDSSNINNGNEYIIDDDVTFEQLNAIVNNSLYASDTADTAISTSNQAISTANSALSQVVEKQGTVVTLEGEALSTWSADFAESERQKIKNLLLVVDSSATIYDYTMTCKDGVFTINGGNGTGESTFILSGTGGVKSAPTKYYQSITLDNTNSIKLSAGTYTISATIPSAQMGIIYGDLGTTSQSGASSRGLGANITLTFTKTTYVCVYRYLSGSAMTNVSLGSLQIEEGSTATDYQPYNGAIVHEKEVSDVEHIETIYDKDGVLATNIVKTSAIPEGQAYTTGLPSGITCYIGTSKYKRVIFYIKVESYQYRIEVDKNISTPNVLVKDFNNNDITIWGGYPDNFSTTFGTEGTVIVKIEGVY